MPYSEELGREYTEQEARFWREVQHVGKAGSGIVRVAEVGDNRSWSLQRTKQFVSTWVNDDLVRKVGQSPYKVTLTPFGRRFTFEERYRDIEG